MRIRRLRIVHPGQVRSVGDDCAAVSGRPERAQTRLHGLGLNAVGAGKGRGSQGVRHDRGGRVGAVRPRQVRNVREGGSVTRAVLHECAINQQALDDAELRDARRAEGQPDRASPLHDVGVLHHLLHASIGRGIDAGADRVLVDARLIGRVRLHGAMPVQVIRIHVQADRCQGRDGPCRVQLEAGQLHRKHLGVRVNRPRNRRTDIADLLGLGTRAAQDLTEHADRRRLTVRAGHDQPRATRVRAFFLQTPSEFNLAPHLDAGGLAGREDRVVCGNARRHDDEVGAGLDDSAREGVGILVGIDGNARDILEREGLSPARVEGTHLPVAREQRASSALPGLAPTDDSSETTHRRDTHSA